MPLLRRFVLVCLALLVCLMPLSSWAQTASTITSVVVFGDSLSDTGNIANLTQSQYKIRYPADNPVLGFDYTDGRFTDGTDTQPAASTAYKGVWIEQLAALYGVTVKDSLDGGTNYAYGDATTGSGTMTESKTYLGVPISITLQNMGQQVTTYLATNPTPNASTLYVLWGGSNDLLNAASAGQDPLAAAQTALTNELGLVKQLMARGATNFLIPNLPPLGAFATANGPAAVTALNNASAAFAQGLATGITQLQQASMGTTLKIYPADVFTYFAQIAATPMMYGFGDITTAADTVTASPDTYLLWDGLHPTTTGHHWAATAAAAFLDPPLQGGFTLNAPAAVLAGQSVTVSAIGTSVRQVVPSGLVTLFNGTSVAGSAAMDATGTAKITFTPTGAAGTSLSLTAVYVGDLTNSSAVSKVVTVPLLNAAVGTTTAVTSSSATANPGAAVTFTATVTPASSSYGAPAGTVAFQDGTSTLGTGTLTNGVATYTTSALTAGTHQITATYAAAGVFGGSTSAAITETIAAPGFTASANPASLTIASGASGTSTLTVSVVGGYTGTVTPTCGTLPAHFACSIAPLSTANPVNIPSSYTLTIATNGATTTAMTENPAPPGAWQGARVWSASLLLPGTLGLMGFGLRRRRRGVRGLLHLSLAMLFCAGLLGVTGCGGGSNNNAPAGSYSVPVVFTPSITTGGVAAQTVNIAVTVQ